MDKKKIGAVIKKHRTALGLTQEQFAELIDLSAVYIRAIERGAKMPRLERLIDISNTLGVTTDILLQDSLVHKSKIQSLELFDKLKHLPEDDQLSILSIIDFLIELATEKNIKNDSYKI